MDVIRGLSNISLGEKDVYIVFFIRHLYLYLSSVIWI